MNRVPRLVRVRVSATTANLGPGFDCLGLALDLWNTATLRLAGNGVRVTVRGEGAGRLPGGAENLVAHAALALFRRARADLPSGLEIECDNSIPLGSGMGSSAAAALAGLLGANALLGEPFDRAEILRLAVEIEGHADNAAAALEGGLVILAPAAGGWTTRRVEVPPLPVTLVLPAVDLPTRAARAALPAQVSLADAVFNLGRTALVVEALRSSDLALLSQVMDDRLHQPYRYALIPGAQAARDAALQAGAAAACLSGAGPSLAAFGGDPAQVAAAMQSVFQSAGIASRSFLLGSSPIGSYWMTE